MKKKIISSVVLLALSSLAKNSLAADFTNGGFESGNITGWSQGSGKWSQGQYNPTPLTGPPVYIDPTTLTNPPPSPIVSIVSTGFDPVVTALPMVYAGNNAVRVNFDTGMPSGGRDASWISQTVNSYGSSTINFAWSAVLEDGGHPADEQAHFYIQIVDVTNGANTIVHTTSYNASSPSISLQSNGALYSGWQSESVAVTQGNDYKITLLAADCSAGGHYGYVYLDGFGLVAVQNLLAPSGPSLEDTTSSLQSSASQLRGSYNLQSAIINTGLSYDCTTFDKNGICVSAGGRVTDTNNPSTNSQGALLIASYRANEQWRVGAYLDQNLSSNDARGVNLDNNNPMGGVFAVWNQNTDGTGYQVRLASGYSDKDVTISRSAFGATGEAGKGDSSLQSQAYSATLSRGFQLNNTRWIASPYLGVRYTKIKRAGYTEDSSADVTTPLTYSALSQETTTALVGLRFNGQFGDKVNLMASAGIENDIAHNTGDYAATGVDGLTPIAFNQNIRHIRPVASAGVSYAIDKRQTVGANLNFRQEAFNSTNSVSGMVTYQVGF